MTEFTITETELAIATNHYLHALRGLGPGEAMREALEEIGIETVPKPIQEPSDPNIIVVDVAGVAWKRVACVPTDYWAPVDREATGDTIRCSWGAIIQDGPPTLYRKVE